MREPDLPFLGGIEHILKRSDANDLGGLANEAHLKNCPICLNALSDGQNEEEVDYDEDGISEEKFQEPPNSQEDERAPTESASKQLSKVLKGQLQEAKEEVPEEKPERKQGTIWIARMDELKEEAPWKRSKASSSRPIMEDHRPRA